MKQFAAVFSFVFLLLFSSTLIEQPNASANALEQAKKLVEEEYVGEVKGNIREAKTIDELMSYLDEHSVAYTPEEYNSFLENVEQQTVGIGVMIEKHTKGLLITNIIKGGSAEAAGLEAGDIITAVDGKDISRATLNEASSKIIGPPDTQVNITFINSFGEKQNLTLIRKLFTVENATSELLYGNIGYIAFSSFSSTVDREITREYNFLKSIGATSFILDVRGNGGGFVDAAQKVIGMFPKAKWAFEQIDSNGQQIFSANTDSRNRAIFPEDTKLLINGGSASASEMLAAALKDQKAAFLYGTTTYGKGTMQGFFELAKGEYYIKLTIAEFRSPDGNVINKVGIQPDTESDFPLQQAHLQSLIDKHANYKALPKLENVPTTKTFKITFNKSLTNDIQEDAIELVELGGKKLDVHFKQQNNQLIVTPVKPLKPGNQYVLLIHQTTKSIDNKNLKKGNYLHIKVSK